MWLCYRGSVEEVTEFLSDNPNVHVNTYDYDLRYPLHIAASEGHTGLVHYLLQQKANVDAVDRFGNNALVDALRQRHEGVAALLRKHKSSLPQTDIGTVLCKNAFHNRLEETRQLFENGVSVNNPDYDGRTALHLAAACGHISVVQFLVKAKADLHATDRFEGRPLEDALRHEQVLCQTSGSRPRGNSISKLQSVSVRAHSLGRLCGAS